MPGCGGVAVRGCLVPTLPGCGLTSDCGLSVVGCAGFGAGQRQRQKQRGRRFTGRGAAEALDSGGLGAGGLGLSTAERVRRLAH